MTGYIDKSDQITHRLRKSFQSTDCKMANRLCYGYDKIENTFGRVRNLRTK